MEELRVNLRVLMELKGFSAIKMEKKSGVPAPTTYRFLTGQTDEPKGETVARWAAALEVTEAQLRGHTPLGKGGPRQTQYVDRYLSGEEKKLLSVLAEIPDEPLKRTWFRLGTLIAEVAKKEHVNPHAKDSGYDGHDRRKNPRDRRKEEGGGGSTYNGKNKTDEHLKAKA